MASNQTIQFVIFLAILTFSYTRISTRKTVELTQNIQLDVKKGDQLRFQLAGNPSTGYSWFYKSLANKIAIPQNLDKYNSGKLVSYNNRRFMVGVGGKFNFDFKIIKNTKKKTTKIVFEYKRPWEKYSLYEYTITLNLN